MWATSGWWPDVLARLFKRRERVSGESLPMSVEASLQGLTATARTDHEGKARVLLCWASDGPAIAWHHTPEETHSRMAVAFPGLSPNQMALACRAVAGKVRAAQADRPESQHARTWSARTWATRSFDTF